MPKYCKIEIDVRPHVKKYITYHLGKQPLSYSLDQEIKLDVRNFIGCFILQLLQEQFVLKKNKKQIVYNNKRLNDKITIALSELHYAKIDPRYTFIGIQDKGEILLDDFIDGIMKKEMFIMAESYKLNNRTVKDAISDFMLLYSITDDDIQSDSLYREYNRMFNKLNHSKL